MNTTLIWVNPTVPVEYSEALASAPTSAVSINMSREGELIYQSKFLYYGQLSQDILDASAYAIGILLDVATGAVECPVYDFLVTGYRVFKFQRGTVELYWVE